MGKDDIILFLNSSRKNEITDPLHSWMATHNQCHKHQSRILQCSKLNSRIF